MTSGRQLIQIRDDKLVTYSELERELEGIEEAMRDDLDLIGTPKLREMGEHDCCLVLQSADFNRIAYLIHKYIQKMPSRQKMFAQRRQTLQLNSNLFDYSVSDTGDQKVKEMRYRKLYETYNEFEVSIT